ncbi:MAG: hypothetical protein CMF46_05245 [Legionellales bacterium]|nr:hypothetical protein [Legionellales bacterium]|tara:strand:+ start:482 stop:1390 length:909 start_codon:yes stop_codon:yes gene_type:complete
MAVKKTLRSVTLLLALITGFLISYRFGQAQTSSQPKSLINPHHQLTQSNIAIEQLTMLSLTGPIQTTIEYSDHESIDISVPEDYIPFLKIEQKPSTLHIQYSPPSQEETLQEQKHAVIHLKTPNNLKRLYTYKEAKTTINNIVSISHIGAAGSAQIIYHSDYPQIIPLSLHMNNSSDITLDGKRLNLAHINTETVAKVHAKGIDNEEVNINAKESSSVTAEGYTHFTYISASNNSKVDIDGLTSSQTSIYTRDYANIGIGPTQYITLYAKGDSKTFNPHNQSISSYMSKGSTISESQFDALH